MKIKNRPNSDFQGHIRIPVFRTIFRTKYGKSVLVGISVRVMSLC